MKTNGKNLWWVLSLIAVVSGLTAYASAKYSNIAVARPLEQTPVTMHTHLVQDKVHQGSNGHLSVALTFSAAKAVPRLQQPEPKVDLVLVLDRSGSMSGQKMHDAKLAIHRLIDQLNVDDRLALVTYSNGVETVSPLVFMDHHHRHQFKAAVSQLGTGGGTNLGGGLQGGIHALANTPSKGRQRKVMLISDGLANHGVTAPNALGQMAAQATEQRMTISTLGVGHDFNELLMTTIADHGAGSYYFLEDPQQMAHIFEHAFQTARQVSASDVELRIPLETGVRLVHAGGYPITYDGNTAVIHPGDLLAGQQRKLYLTFQVPADKERTIALGAIHLTYTHNGRVGHLHNQTPLTVACVADPHAVAASIDKAAWEGQVVQEAFGQLQEEVATAIRQGKKEQALDRIHDYEARNREVNASVDSSVVADNLDHDVQGLRQSVEQTFSGPAAAVAEKKKQRAKTLQYESYKSRRDKQ